MSGPKDTAALKATFSTNLNRYIKNADMNTADLAAALSVPFSTVADWVHGRKYPRMDKVQAIADYFGVLKSDLTEDRDLPAPRRERQISDDDIRAAFFGGADDLTKEEMDAMWDDAKDYVQYKLEQRRRKKNGETD